MGVGSKRVFLRWKNNNKKEDEKRDSYRRLFLMTGAKKNIPKTNGPQREIETKRDLCACDNDN